MGVGGKEGVERGEKLRVYHCTRFFNTLNVPTGYLKLSNQDFEYQLDERRDALTFCFTVGEAF